MTTKTRSTWEERVAEIVACGYSQEFAERFVPMTISEARARKMTTGKFQSELAGFVNRRAAR